MGTTIKFLQTGGVPLTNDLMDTLQEAYSIFNALGDLAGHLTILSGCILTGQNVSPGVVAINGEVLYFEGGLNSTSVYINTIQVSKTFQDQTDKILIEKKTVKFGLSSPDNMWNWADFIRLETIKSIQEKVNNSVTQEQHSEHEQRLRVLEMKTSPIINGGIAWAWFKPKNEIPVGWKECVSIRGKTIVGLDPNDPVFSTLGTNIGEKTHTLTVPELPRHSFVIPFGKEKVGTGNRNGVSSNGGNEFLAYSSEIGADLPHNNIQPSTIAYFIEPNF